jgi:hypothetical protein
LHSGSSYDTGDYPRRFKARLIKYHDFREPKKRKYEISVKIGSGCGPRAANGKSTLAQEIQLPDSISLLGRGDFLIGVGDRTVLWQAEVHGVEVQNYPPILSIRSPKEASMWKFNKNYVVGRCY